jgi:hypothetical protein
MPIGRRAVALETQNLSKPLPDHLLAALEEGYLTQEQLQELIAFQAARLDLEFDEAVRRAYDDTLPRNITGDDIRVLVSLLDR